MPEQDALQVAKELLEAETLTEKNKETPTLDTPSVEDDALYRDADGGNAKVAEPKADTDADKKKKTSKTRQRPSSKAHFMSVLKEFVQRFRSSLIRS